MRVQALGTGAEDPGPPGDEAGGLRRRKKGKDSAWVKATPNLSISHAFEFRIH